MHVFFTLSRRDQLIFGLLCFGCFIVSFNVAAISAALPEISEGLRLPDWQVAKLITYYLIPYGMGALIYAPMARFVTYKRIYVSAFIFFFLANIICGMALNLQLMLWMRALMGVAGSCAIPLGLMIIGELFQRNIRGRLVGLFFSHAFIASICGLICLAFFPWQMLFYVPGALSLLLVIFILLFHIQKLAVKHIGHINYFKIIHQPRVLKILAFIFILSFLYHGVHKWYGIYLSQNYGMHKTSISSLVLLTVVAGMVGQNLGGYISDKSGRHTACYVGLLGLGLMTMCLKTMHPVFLLGLIMALIALFWTVGHNGISTTLTDFAHDYRPMIASLNSSVRFISGGLGFYVSQFFVEKSFG
ncbi:MAG: MFS transporter, partial [Candidatus Omnitrophica bacterium]|nr:MFS transporter [Candidatus Omnitrophota bacterium]